MIINKVYKIIKETNQLGLPYITKESLIKQLEQKYPKTDNWRSKVGQAVYHLQQKTKLREPRIVQYFDVEERKYVGYTIPKTI